MRHALLPLALSSLLLSAFEASAPIKILLALERLAPER